MSTARTWNKHMGAIHHAVKSYTRGDDNMSQNYSSRKHADTIQPQRV